MKHERKTMLDDIMLTIKENYEGDLIKYVNESYHYFTYIIFDKNINVYVQVNDNYTYSVSTQYNYGLEEQQKSYFQTFYTIEDVLNFINNDLNRQQPPVKANKDRLSLDLYSYYEGKTQLNYMKSIFGFREKEIFNNLFYIKIMKHENKDLIYFYDNELNYFAYSCYTHKIVN